MKEKASFSKLIFWILALVFLWLIISHFGQTKEIFLVLSTGKWYWIVLAILCQLFYYPYYAYFSQKVFEIFRVKIPAMEILPVYVASKFTDVALPVATVGQVAIFVRNGRKHNVSPLNSGIAISFVLLFEVAAFVTVAFFALLMLYIFHKPANFLLISLFILASAVTLVVVFLYRRAVLKKAPNRLFLWLIKIASKIAGQGNVPLSALEDIFLEIGEDLKNGRHKILPSLGRAIITHLINLVTFGFIFLAFAGSANPLAILAGYVACLLFTIVSITPQGVGVAETVMVATLHSFGLNIPTAAVVTLAFRGLLYWLPLFAGFYFFSRLELKNDDRKTSS